MNARAENNTDEKMAQNVLNVDAAKAKVGNDVVNLSYGNADANKENVVSNGQNSGENTYYF